jgi:pyruvate, orthophosphate dikinase
MTLDKRHRLFSNFRSQALDVNLQNTAVEVQIPKEQMVLSEMTETVYGVNKRVMDFLTELNHPFFSPQHTLELYRALIVGDFAYFIGHPRSNEALAQILGIGQNLLQRLHDSAQIDYLLQSLFEFIRRLGENRESQSYDAQLEPFFQWLTQFVGAEYRPVYMKLSQIVQRACAGFRNEALLQAIRALVHQTLRGAYIYWRDGFRIQEWYEKHKADYFPDADYQSFAAQFSAESFEKLLTELEKATTLESLYDLPDFSDIAHAIRNEIESIANPLDKISFLVHLLEFPGFESFNDQILFDINRHFKDIRDSEPAALARFIRTIFQMLEYISTNKKQILLEGIKTFGKEIFSLGDRFLSELFVEKLILYPFETPDIKGVTTEWQTLVNPNHLVNVRTWLAIIQENPAYANKLISALLVNLTYGGFFISDTDLFQKDVTALLNSNILESYNLVKQLTRFFPVFFTEIGAEGELRDVSTRVDQMCNRKDLLLHFLRKQVHAESNNTLTEFARAILEFWRSGKQEFVTIHLPEEVARQIDPALPMYAMMFPLTRNFFKRTNLKIDDLLGMPIQQLENEISKTEGGDTISRQKLSHLIRLFQLLDKKYSFNFVNLFDDLEKQYADSRELLKELKKANRGSEYRKALILSLDLMEKLQSIILNPEPGIAEERIYYKRHVAAGIPSMYGTYKEAKFEALGFSFRLEEFSRTLIEKLIGELNLDLITQSSLREIVDILKLLLWALNIDGIRSEALKHHLTMLERSLLSNAFSVDQYINIFQFIADSLRAVTVKYYLGNHNDTLRAILPIYLKQKRGEKSPDLYKEMEDFNRRMIVSSFGLSYMDLIVGRVLNTLSEMRHTLDRKKLRLLMNYNPNILISHITGPITEFDNQVYLGSKGYFLKRLWHFDFPVPDGFILTTELFRSVPIFDYRNLYIDAERRIFQALKRLEKAVGQRFGDPQNPLLLSVRSGSAISLPGMMNTFLNMGMNDKVAKILSKQPNYGWTSWDCYRRIIQIWSMAHGMTRDSFDDIINHFKQKYKVESKIKFTNQQMEEISWAYKEAMLGENINFPEDVRTQLLEAIYLVLSSWDSEKAKVYRRELDIADDWGTAVIIQKMVLGNIHEMSGTGVAFTRNPHKYSSEIELFGDFVLTSQGEDIVSGLVYPQPVSQSQKTGADDKASMEEALPGIYSQLLQYAKMLLNQHNFEHQEIEFTFESPEPQDLWILQTRNMTTMKHEKIPIFKMTPDLEKDYLALGMGMGGGALSGRIAFDEDGIKAIRQKYPQDAVILLRPDTVPDDIKLIFQSDAILTSRGGYTSHAAVTANSLGKTCVVNCRALKVYDQQQQAKIGNVTFHAGDKISIEGRLGRIYKGRHEVEYVSEISLDRRF